MAKTKRWVYFFGGGKADGDGTQKELLGGKGAGLAEMTRIGLPVPAGFTISTSACESYNAHGSWPEGLEKEVRFMLGQLEKQCKKKLGAAKDPLLVSVRSGAAKSMPGMMETILNLGLNDESVEGLSAVADNRRFAFDSYRRFIMMYGSTAKGINREKFDDVFDRIKRDKTAPRLGRGADDKVVDTDVSTEELEAVVAEYKELFQQETGVAFPQDPFEQLCGAINAVFDSWMSEKAVTYRRVENIQGLNGTAVNICQMVFGNMGDDSGTGVCFTRDPSTGEPVFYGDLLINAQGEDVVAGIRTPIPLSSLSELMPEVYEQLEAVRIMLEVHYKNMQDLEFTIERGKLYMLQCRNGKRSPSAAFKIAVDQATSGICDQAEASKLVKKKYLPKAYLKSATKPVITRDEAIQRIDATDVERLFLPIIDPAVDRETLSARECGEGIGAVPGAAYGEIAFSAAKAEEWGQDGRKVILVRKETSPEDVGGMHASAGILTATGGKTSHAAVVARGWGKCCIVGCDHLRVDYGAGEMTLGGKTFREGDSITLDGGTGKIYDGEIGLQRPDAPAEFDMLMGWCDERRHLRVRTNADTPEDAAKAVSFGAEGIGLCRTEHMFFDPSEPQRIRAMREMILAETKVQRERALEKLLPFQRKDFEGIFEAMNGKPVTIRLLDPPLHEFLPQHDNVEGQQAVVDDLNESAATGDGTVGAVTLDDVKQRVDQLHESNPMLGHRGCRLAITYPEILDMQVTAIIEAAVACEKRGIDVLPEIMIPLSIDDYELALLIDWTRDVADNILESHGSNLKYLVGTMIETPRAALMGDAMADTAEFFSFGTNDLTQTTMALSRDDAGRFLPYYINEELTGIFETDPFQTIDVAGVGMLVQLACYGARETREDIKLGICGEHGGDPESIRFFAAIGLEYVSCSPYRVPVARLAAAQSVIELEEFEAEIGGMTKKAKRKAASSGSKPRAKAASGKSAKKATNKKAKVKAKATGKTGKKKKAAPKRKKAAAKAKRKSTGRAKVKAKKAGKKRAAAKKKGAGKKKAGKKAAAKGKKKAKKKRAVLR